jgi:hypothetical protein
MPVVSKCIGRNSAFNNLNAMDWVLRDLVGIWFDEVGEIATSQDPE